MADTKTVPLEEIKRANAVDIVDVWHRLGLPEVPASGMVRSPFRDDQNASMQVGGKANIAYDHGTRETWKPVRLARVVKNCPVPDAVDWILESESLFSTPPEAARGQDRNNSDNKRKSHKVGHNYWWQSAEEAQSAVAGMESARENEAARTMLQERYGLTLEMIPENWTVCVHPKSKRNGILYPYAAQDGSIGYKWRGLENDPTAKRFCQWGFKQDPDRSDYAMSLGANQETSILVVVGGEEKAAAIAAAGYPCLCLNSESARLKPRARALAETGVRIIFALDTGEEECVAKNAGTLLDTGMEQECVLTVRWPDDAPRGFDLNDVLKTQGIEGVRHLLETAKPLPVPEALVEVSDGETNEWPPLESLEGVVPEAEEFPVDTLPWALRGMVRGISEMLGTRMELPATAVLGCASIAARNTVEVEIKPGHIQRANLFFMGVADVGNMKSPTIKAAQEPLLTWMSEKRIEWHDRCAEQVAAQTTHDVRAKEMQSRLKKAAKGSNGDPLASLRRELADLERERPRETPEPCLVISDATPERAARRMMENDEAIGVLDGEGRTVAALCLGRYSSNGGVDPGMFLRGHAGDRYSYDRQGKPSFVIDSPTLSVCLLTQPDTLRKLGQSEGLRDCGFLARFLYVLPDRCFTEYPEAVIPEEVRGVYGRALHDLLKLERSTAPGGGRTSRLYRLERSAFLAWKDFHDEVRRTCHEEHDQISPFMHGWYAKLPEHAARLALLLHVLESPDQESIPEAVVRRAMMLAEWFKGQALRAEVVMGGTGTEADTAVLWRWIDERREEYGERIRRADIYQKGPRVARPKANAERLAGKLVEAGYLRKAESRGTYLIRPTTV